MQRGIASRPPAGVICRPTGGRVRSPPVLASGGNQAAEPGASRRGVRLPFSELGGLDSREHVVRGRGAGDDTLEGLCARYGVLPAEVVDANPGLVRHTAQQFKPGTKVLILAPDAMGTARRAPHTLRRRAQADRGKTAAATVAAETRRPQYAAGPAALDVLASAVLLTLAAAGWLSSTRRSGAFREAVSGSAAEESPQVQARPRMPAPRFIPSWRAAEAMTASSPPGDMSPAPSTSTALVRVTDAENHWRREAREHVARAADAGFSLTAAWNLAVAAACSAAASACNAAAWAALQALRIVELLRRGVSFIFVDAGSAAIEPPVTHRAAEALRATAMRAQQEARGSRASRDYSSRRKPGSSSSSSRGMGGRSGTRGRSEPNPQGAR